MRFMLFRSFEMSFIKCLFQLLSDNPLKPFLSSCFIKFEITIFASFSSSYGVVILVFYKTASKTVMKSIELPIKIRHNHEL